MIGGVTSNHMLTMLEGVKENARLQVERIKELEVRVRIQHHVRGNTE
jgi:hypothetical protein